MILLINEKDQIGKLAVKVSVCFILHLLIKELLGIGLYLLTYGTAADPRIISVFNTVYYGVMMSVFMFILMRFLKVDKRDIFKPFNESRTELEPFIIFKSIALLILFSLFASFLSVLLENLGFTGLAPDSAFPYARDDTFSIVLYFFMTVILAGVLEEVIFRCIIMRCFLKYGEGLAVFVSAFLFGIVHIYPIQVLFAFFCGLIIAKADLKCGSARVGVAIHMLNNFISVVLSFIAEYAGAEKSADITFKLLILIFSAGLVSSFILRLLGTRKKQSIETECETGKKVFLHPSFLIMIGIYILYAWWCLYGT